MSVWWFLPVTETCSKLYIIEYIVVFWLNDILVNIITQRDVSYRKKTVILPITFLPLPIKIEE